MTNLIDIKGGKTKKQDIVDKADDGAELLAVLVSNYAQALKANKVPWWLRPKLVQAFQEVMMTME